MINKEVICTQKLGGDEAVSKYENALRDRINQHPYENNSYSQVVSEINNNGYSIIKGALDSAKILSIRERVDKICSGHEVSKVREIIDQTCSEILPGYPNAKSPELLTKLDELTMKFVLGTNDARYQSLSDALLAIPEILELATSKPIYNVAAEFYGCKPFLTGAKVHKTLANNLASHGTDFFHFDQNSLWFIKAFIYLNDVGLNDGPFTYVEGSHNKRFPGWNEYREERPEKMRGWPENLRYQQCRFLDQEIIDNYGEEKIKPLTAKVGDVIFANTVGIHKAGNLISGERGMITLNFAIHPEQWRPVEKRPQIKQSDIDKVDEEKRSLFDLLKII